MLLCAVPASRRCEHQFALKAKSKLKRHDLIYQRLGIILREQGRQHSADPICSEPGGAAVGTLGSRGAERGPWAPEGSWVHVPSWGRNERLSSPPVSAKTHRRLPRCSKWVVSTAALGHTGPVLAAAREAGFADAAEGAVCVHAAFTLAQKPALVQLSALIDVNAARARGV